jgi:hypothetical protein
MSIYPVDAGRPWKSGYRKWAKICFQGNFGNIANRRQLQQRETKNSLEFCGQGGGSSQARPQFLALSDHPHEGG